jgi:hypothetical protein
MVMRLAPYLSRLGIFRLGVVLGAVPGHGDLPVSIGAAYDAVNLTTKFWDTLSDQNDAMTITSQQVLGTSHNWGALPLIVLSAPVPDHESVESRQTWTAVNAELATRSSNGVHRVVEGAVHMDLAWDQEKSQATIAAIYEVLGTAIN